MKLLNIKKIKYFLSLIFLLCLLTENGFANKSKAPALIDVQSKVNGSLVEISISIQLTSSVEKVSVLIFNKGIDQEPELLVQSNSKEASIQEYRFVFNKELQPNIDRLPIGISFLNKNIKIHESFAIELNSIKTQKHHPNVVKPKNGEAVDLILP
jgi:hypothetical protein